MKNEILQNIHPDLLDAQKLMYEPHGLRISNLIKEANSKEYGAFEFKLNDLQVKFRSAKITPTKIGQFVTLWKRVGNEPILPYDVTDPIDLFIISVRNCEHFGQFVFPKAILYEKGILSKEGKGGKRAIRVYPPWDITNNRQAKQTQAWQLLYFFEIHLKECINAARLQKLFLL
jgi:hypothetical protein